MNTIVAILRGVSDGKYSAQIARQIKQRRSLFHYYVGKLENAGLIEKQEGVVKDCLKARGAIAFYRLTESGSNFLAGIEKKTLRCQMRFHNCYWLYPSVRQPEARIDWRRVELQNWGQLVGWIKI